MFKVIFTLGVSCLLVAIFFPWDSRNQPEKYSPKNNEGYYNDLFCASLGGQREVRHYYKYGTKKSYIKVDCETKDYVYEGGLDKRSSLDSIQQVIFFSILTKKKPAVIVFDTDNQVGKYEHRIKLVANRLGVKFDRIKNESLGTN